jgi:hypothetical protein
MQDWLQVEQRALKVKMMAEQQEQVWEQHAFSAQLAPEPGNSIAMGIAGPTPHSTRTLVKDCSAMLARSDIPQPGALGGCAVDAQCQSWVPPQRLPCTMPASIVWENVLKNSNVAGRSEFPSTSADPVPFLDLNPVLKARVLSILIIPDFVRKAQSPPSLPINRL